MNTSIFRSEYCSRISIRTIVTTILITVAVQSLLRAQTTLPGLLPDLRTIVPQQLQLVNEHQRDILRFSNGIANTGDGPWRMRPRFPLVNISMTQDAIQEILDAN